MAWVFLFLAGLFEIGWAMGLKQTEGFTRLVPSLVTAGCMIVSLGLLGLALRSLPLGTAYAIWTGIGTVGTVVVGHDDLRRTRQRAAAWLHNPHRGRDRRAEAGAGFMIGLRNLPLHTSRTGGIDATVTVLKPAGLYTGSGNAVIAGWRPG